MVLVESDLNSEQVSLMRPINTEKFNFGRETSGPNSKGGLNFDWSFQWNFTVVI